MTDFLADVLLRTAIIYAVVLGFVLILCAAELAFPRGKLLPLKERWRIVSFSLVYIFAATALAEALSPYMGGGSITGWPALILSVILTDFLYYWYHRAQHTFSWLWWFHSVHHSAEELGAGASYNHLLEAPGRVLFIGLPLSFVLTEPVAPLIGALLYFHGWYVHSATRLNLGPVAWLIADNRTHRIHHSTEPRHFNLNYGRYTMIWDRLFRTSYDPKDEWPTVGLPDQPEPRTVWQFLKLPPRPISAQTP